MPLFHVWFATKRRKWLLEGDVGDLAERVMREIARKDRIAMLECKAVIDHVHLLLDLPSAADLPSAMKALKGKSAHQVFLAAPELKLDAETNHFWQRGYGSRLVEPGAAATVRRYIRTQMERLEKFER